MEKIYGAHERQDGLYCIGRNKYELFYGFGKDSEEAEIGYNYRQTFRYKPTPDECAKIIKATINKATEQTILNGFVWRDMPVWLSAENQFDYKTAYDLAVQTSGETLPVRFKFGTDENPQYFVFDNMEEFSDFYRSAVRFVNETLTKGWAEKDWIDNNTTMFS